DPERKCLWLVLRRRRARPGATSARGFAFSSRAPALFGLLLVSYYNLKFMPSLRVLLTADQIRSRIHDLGVEIDRDYPNGPVYLVGILKGACIFLSDLARAMTTPARLEFVGISSYGKGRSTSGEVKLTKDLDASVEGHDVIVVEDIVDSGITLS